MCTISWLADVDTYHVFFNRDESREREGAEAPRQFSANGVDMLMPIDPIGKGSWIVTNSLGISLALLNFYQGETPLGTLISRGQIIRQLGHVSSEKQAYEALSQWPLKRSAPFSLLVFSPASDVTAIPLLEWDGKTLQEKVQSSPLISSAFDVDGVTQVRAKQFADVLKADAPMPRRVQTLMQLHQSHTPSKSAYSICMHRRDAHTVSFTHVAVDRHSASMSYQLGSPCQGRAPSTSILLRNDDN